MFSDEVLAAEIERRFVPVWINGRPEQRFEPRYYEKLDERTYESFGKGRGAGNVTSIFAMPDGTVLNAVPGYLDAASFRAESSFALDLNERIVLSGRLRDGALDIYRQAHRERAGEGSHAARAHAALAARGFVGVEDTRFLNGRRESSRP